MKYEAILQIYEFPTTSPHNSRNAFISVWRGIINLSEIITSIVWHYQRPNRRDQAGP